MKAPKSAIYYIIKAFKGEEEAGGTDGWLVTFRNQEDAESVCRLIDTINGWEATMHPNVINMVEIKGDE